MKGLWVGLLVLLIALAAVAVWAPWDDGPDLGIRDLEQVADPPAAPHAADQEVTKARRVRDVTKNPGDVERRVAPAGGVLRHEDGRFAAGLDYWVFGEDPPGWVRGKSEKPQLMRSPTLPEQSGATDWEGRWRIPAGVDEATARAVTFRVADGVFASFALETGAARAFVLPRMTEASVTLSGGPSTAKWRILLYPAIQDGIDENFGEFLVRTIETQSGPAVTGIAWRNVTMSAAENLTFTALHGGQYAVNAWGRGFTLEPDLQYFSAPGVAPHRFVQAHPVVDVEVTDGVGGPVANVSGRIVLRKPPESASNSDPLKKGRGQVNWERFEPDALYHLHVVLADGEQFLHELRFGGGEPRKKITCARGAGMRPIAVRFPKGRPPAAVAHVAVEDGKGQLRWGNELAEQHFLEDPPSPSWFLRKNEIFLNNLPRDWLQAWIVTARGRVAEATAIRDATTVQAAWLRDTPLERIDVRAIHGAKNAPERGNCYAQLQLTSSKGHTAWCTFVSHRFQAETRTWPVWELFAPVACAYRIMFWGKGVPRLEIPVKRRE